MNTIIDMHDAPSFTPTARHCEDLPKHVTPVEAATLDALRRDADAFALIAVGGYVVTVALLLGITVLVAI